jgi:flavin reductase (DIM6/NTAB) family NADH-FMN oxidoreductase RutF
MNTMVSQEVTAGDHVIVLVHVNELRVRSGVAPIAFHHSALRRLAPEQS